MDASKLTFPLQIVIVIIGGIIATTGAFWVSTSALRSDVRDILTRMEMQQRGEADKAIALHEQFTTLGAQISATERRQELLRLEFEKLREEVLFKDKGAK